MALCKAGAIVTWLCPRALASLISDLGIETLPVDQSVKLNDFDYYCPSSTLPLHFNLTIDNIDGTPYLVRPDPDRRGQLIGVMTAGNPNNIEGRPRTLTRDQATRLESLPSAINLAPESTGARDFRETAAIVTSLEMVITVDTAVAHLAGGLGIPTIVLLPFVADWRWFTDRSDSPWYSSVRIVRQGPDLDWESVVDRALAI
ncbi:glycosyltransferase family 9 protein [Phenylobacterium sp.]|uniref:glycosyltransferase family 9 protein n=1 Tax=Phenylobacterium sp. TaxID=1871053 RepID=UPI003D2D10EE